MSFKQKLSETAIQQHLIKLLNSYARPDIEFHHVPNGEQRNKKTARRLKSMGVQPGVADLMFLIDGQSIALELKSGKGKQTKAQADFQERFERAGGLYILANGINEAVKALIDIAAFRGNVHVNVEGLVG